MTDPWARQPENLGGWFGNGLVGELLPPQNLHIPPGNSPPKNPGNFPLPVGSRAQDTGTRCRKSWVRPGFPKTIFAFVPRKQIDSRDFPPFRLNPGCTLLVCLIPLAPAVGTFPGVISPREHSLCQVSPRVSTVVSPGPAVLDSYPPDLASDPPAIWTLSRIPHPMTAWAN